MATISNTPRPGYAYDSAGDVWYPIGTGPHTHADYITSSSAINPNVVDAKGDIIAATAADTVSRLAVGANDTVLTADSSTATGLKWAAPAAGGMTLISTTTLSGASVTLSSIPATYNDLYVIVRNFLPATDARGLIMRFNADSGANRHALQEYSNPTVLNSSFSDTKFDLSSSNDNAVSNSIHWIHIPDYKNTTTYKFANSVHFSTNSTTTTNYNYSPRFGIYNQTGAISSLEFAPTAGNFTSGTVLLYGVK